ncbi:hypothetical protein [Cytobacillus praedii]|uniref:hypothetical protein n=1 Tax=Cytobacillus praedii TaxID=1742358 RepID=UPI002E1BB648|nr:hypothetical protein [Cytobacillus praedii]
MEYKINGLVFKTPEYWIYGSGKWRDEDTGKIYDIQSLKYPPTPNGKHVYIDSDDGSASYRSLDEGEILSFQSTHIEKNRPLF